MVVVVDASVALKWVLDEEDSDRAEVLRTSSLVAPSLWLAEVSNALATRSRRGELSADEAQKGLARLRRSPIVSHALELDADAALEIALKLGHPIYDCFYLALAVRLDSYVVSADARFIRAATKLSEFGRRIRPL